MKVLIKEPGKSPRQIVIDRSLKTLQDLVGGYIEHLSFCILGVGLIVNEEGKLNELPFNFYFYGDAIVGTAVFVGEAGDEFTDLTDEQISSVMKLFDTEKEGGRQ